MRRTTLPVALVAMLLASASMAQLSASFAEFPASPAGFLMTPSERKAYATITSDAEAQGFVDLFWAKRDPNPETLFNEAKADFEARLGAADKQFSYEGHKGSLSDRARVFYLLGVPSAPIESVAAPPVSEDEDRPIALRRGATQIWKYAKVQLPKSKDDFVQFYFVESKGGAGDFLLDPKDKRNKEGLKLLAERQEKAVLHPKLTEVPRVGLITGTKAATTAQLGVLAIEPKVWPEGAQILAISGVQSDAVRPIWIHAELPDAIAPATEAVGRVTRKDGGEVGTFHTAVTPTSMAGARSYQFSIPIDSGDYTVELALLNETGPLAVRTFEAKSEAVAGSGTYISPMYAGVDPRQEPSFKLGDPFNIGGWRIVPRVSNKYSPAEQLSYFCYIVNPGLDETGNPKYTMDFKLFVDGKPAGVRPANPITLSKIAENLYMFGSGLPLTSFTKPAEYKMEIVLLDQVTKATRSLPIVVVIPGPALAPAAPAK